MNKRYFLVILAVCMMAAAFAKAPEKDAVYKLVSKSYTLNTDGSTEFRKRTELQIFTRMTFDHFGETFITYNPDIEVKITGNYAKITDLDNTNNFIFSTSGSMSKATSVSPYRLYVTKNDEHSDAKITDIQFSFEVEDLKIANEESPVDESPIYNLKGQRVNRANAQQKGVYIKNGKKVIVK